MNQVIEEIDTMADRYSHERAYRGKDYVDVLKQSKVAVCGVGALGSVLVDSLARIGFANILVVDFDAVELGNVASQVYGVMDVGMQKVTALRNRVYRDTGVQIEPVAKRLEKGNIDKVLRSQPLVIDCFDNAESRKLVQEWCRRASADVLHVGLADGYGEVVWDHAYTVPKGNIEGDPCEAALARNLIQLVVAVAAEEIVEFVLGSKETMDNWTVTLRDRVVRKLAR